MFESFDKKLLTDIIKASSTNREFLTMSDDMVPVKLSKPTEHISGKAFGMDKLT